MKTRINYIDNLRIVTVSLVLVYHLAMAYNTWGEANYIFFERVKPIASIVVFISPWFMPLMFLLAGISAAFSLKKRSSMDFIKERFKRLGLPLLFGIIIICPILSFVADKSHNAYNGNYFEHYLIFFTKFTDFTGYDGGVTIGHFWFLAALLVFSCAGCGVNRAIDYLTRKKEKAIFIINGVLIILAIAAFDIDFWGKKILTYFFVYLLGYYLFSKQKFVERLMNLSCHASREAAGIRFGWWLLMGTFVFVSIMNVILFVYLEDYKLLNNICNYISFVTGILALICLGKTYLDYSNKTSRCCARLSYGFYIVHFPIVVLCQYFISLTEVGSVGNFVISFVLSAVLTCGVCFIMDKIAITFLR